MGLKTAGAPVLPMQVRLSFPINGGEGLEQTSRLEIVDDASHMAVMEIEMDPLQLFALLGGKTAYVDAAVTARLDRVGKEMEHTAKHLDRSVFKDQADADAAAEAWRVAKGWDTASVSRNNVGHWVMTGRRWVTPSPDKD